MTLEQVMRDAIRPALALLPAAMDTPQARCMLLAIGLQESRFVHRRQIGGPARGFWQFEQGGGVRGVLAHPASAALARRYARFAGAADGAVRVLAPGTGRCAGGAFARLLLWTDPARLPHGRCRCCLGVVLAHLAAGQTPSPDLGRAACPGGASDRGVGTCLSHG